MSQQQRPVVRSLPQLDVEALAAAAEAEVVDALGVPLVHEAERRAVAAAALLGELEAALPAARAERDLAAWTIWTQCNVRHGANVPGAIGVKRVAWKKIRDRLDAAQPAPMPDALDRLEELATTWFTIHAKIEAALQYRYDAEDDLLTAGWSKADIARLIGRDPSRVSRRTTEGPAAA